MIEFDPNNLKQPKALQWATYIPTRQPKFKVHNGKNHAINAMNYRANSWGGRGSPSILYQFVDGQWKEIDRFEPPLECAHCNRNFDVVHEQLKEEATRKHDEVSEPKRWFRFYASVHIINDHNIKPAYRKPRVCQDCFNKHFSYNSPDKIPVEHVGKVQREF